MPDQIPEDTKHQRSNVLTVTANRMSKDYKDMFLGRIEKILIEEEVIIKGQKYLIGHNERYLKIAVLSKENLINRIIGVRVDGYLTDEVLLGEIL